MACFNSELDVKPTFGKEGGRSIWKLLNPLVYTSDLLASPIYVPEGFETDFASVPRVPVLYLVMNDIGQPAAVVHDFLYRTGLVKRRLADDILFEALGVLGVSWWRREAMWMAVRLGGGFSYKGGKK